LIAYLNSKEKRGKGKIIPQQYFIRLRNKASKLKSCNKN